MAFGTTALKTFQTFLYVLAFCCSTIILGLYSYFLATQTQHHVTIPSSQRAVEGIGGSGVLYTIFAVVLTCFLGGKAFFAFLAIVLDVLFFGAFIAVAILTRHGASCSNDFVRTPLGDGPRESHVGREGAIFTPTLAMACRLNTVTMAVAVIGAIVFLISAFVAVFLGKNHQKHKREAAAATVVKPKTGGIKFFKKKRGVEEAAVTKDAELGNVGAPGTDTYVGTKYEDTSAPVPSAGGYHTGPAGSAVNPYGYDNKTAA